MSDKPKRGTQRIVSSFSPKQFRIITDLMQRQEKILSELRDLMVPNEIMSETPTSLPHDPNALLKSICKHPDIIFSNSRTGVCSVCERDVIWRNDQWVTR